MTIVPVIVLMDYIIYTKPAIFHLCLIYKYIHLLSHYYYRVLQIASPIQKHPVHSPIPFHLF